MVPDRPGFVEEEEVNAETQRRRVAREVGEGGLMKSMKHGL